MKSDSCHQWRSAFLWVARLTSAGLASSVSMPQKHLVTSAFLLLRMPGNEWRYTSLLTFALPAFSARTSRFQFFIGDAQLRFLRLVQPASETGFLRSNNTVGADVPPDIH